MTAVRSCVGCGARDAQPVLVRMTWRDGVLRRDAARSAPGRGAYLHRDGRCWDAFVARRGSIRSLRTSVPRGAREALVAELRAAAKAEGN